MGSLEQIARTGLGIASLPLLGAACPARLLSQEAAFRVFSSWCRMALGLVGVEVSVDDRSGRDWSSGPCVFVGLNQTSLLDAMVFPLVVPVPYGGIMNPRVRALSLPRAGDVGRRWHSHRAPMADAGPPRPRARRGAAA